MSDANKLLLEVAEKLNRLADNCSDFDDFEFQRGVVYRDIAEVIMRVIEDAEEANP